MGKGWKFVASILSLALLVTLFSVFIENQQAVQLPVYFISMDDYPLVGPYAQPILFWLSVGFMVITVLFLIVILFYPKKRNTLIIDHENGTLKVQRRAIENFVLKIVQKEPFIENLTVRAKMTKKKIKIKIAGHLRKSMSISDKQNALVEEVKNEVTTLIGTTDNIKTEVNLQNYWKENTNSGRKVE
ncbi:alkaline shock response membrane anchor protein AmaP [Tetragenococcus muriaticus]|uniref:Alkaline shock response membrane anchor protein AmaP n=1 Tax=Tetragenococcus muriaticus 3MR10-3 TaxID=1302648 RepID=A0A091C3Y6_9ENTE|nr:alkaline shock response membrane anchor protein AmaP [Tetragenococcus muriaticus]KFN91644.1 hypothetical protein TMU3MR103_0935 [Tetragenococcus muriaticus 3MR10-3]